MHPSVIIQSSIALLIEPHTDIRQFHFFRFGTGAGRHPHNDPANGTWGGAMSNHHPKLWEIMTALCTLVLAVTGVAALWFAYDQIKESHTQAQIQHLDDLIRQFESDPALLDARRTLARSRIDEQHKTMRPLKPDDEPDAMDTLLNFFDYVGLLEKRGYLDKTDVWDQFGFYVFQFYTDAQPVIAESQKRDKPGWANVNSLMQDLQAVDEANGLTGSKTITQSDLYDFYSDEAKAQTGQPIPQGKRKR